MQKYKVLIGKREIFAFEMDTSDAAAMIVLEGDVTPFQTETVGHSEIHAAELLNDWMRSQGGGYWDDGEDFEVVEIDDEEPANDDEEWNRQYHC